jgi:signal transduction histidine kinase
MLRSMAARGVFYWLRVPISNIDLQLDEWILAIARLLLSICCLIAGFWAQNSLFPHAAKIAACAYLTYSLIVALTIRIYPNISPVVRIELHFVDLFWAAQLGIFISWPTMFYALFVFVALSTVLRWGFWEALLTCFCYQAILLTSCFQYRVSLPQLRHYQDQASIILDVFAFIVALLVIALLAEAKASHTQNYSTFRMLQRLRLESGLTEAMRVVLSEGLRMFGATQMMTLIHETSTGKLMLFRITSTHPVLESLELDASHQPEYFFPAPAASFRLSTARHLELPQFRCMTLESGKLNHCKANCGVPESFVREYPFRILLASSFPIQDEWAVRVFVIDPAALFNGSAGLRFLEHGVRSVTPLIKDLFLVRRLRTRTEAAVQSRVARELHDGVIQSLSGISMQLEEIRRQTGNAFAKGRDPLARIQQSISEEIAALRDFTQQLRTLQVDAGHFLEFITGLAVKFQCENGITTRFISDVVQVNLRPGVCTELARIVQEALVNVRKHSSATEVLVRLHRRDGAGVLAIMDNGRGFGFSGRREHSELQASGSGPVVIMERADAISGKVSIESAEGKGAMIEVTFPY